MPPTKPQLYLAPKSMHSMLLMRPWTSPIFDFCLIIAFSKTGRDSEGTCMNADSYMQTLDIRVSFSYESQTLGFLATQATTERTYIQNTGKKKER